MAITHGPLGTISTKEKVESWMASTSEVQNPIDGQQATLFQMMPVTTFVQSSQMSVADPPARDRQRSLAVSRQPGNSQYALSCDSIFKKYFPPNATVVSKLMPGFQKAARRRQTMALLRKHAFRWASISSKKFVMIRTDGCNMVPWTDVSEYFFPSCDDPSCEIVLLALKYSMGYPKMTRHIHPCSQREQLKYGDLFKVVPYGTILVDIDAVLANKPVLWTMVEDMHISALTREKMSRCSYRCPEKTQETNRQAACNVPRSTTPVSDYPSQRAHNNSPCGKARCSPIHPWDATETKLKLDNDFAAPAYGANMVEFLGAQAAQMWTTLSEGKNMPVRPSKSLSDATPSKHSQTGKDGLPQNHPESSLSDHSFRNTDKETPTCDGPLLRQCDGTATDLVPPGTTEPECTTVVGLRVNNNRFVPVVLSGDCSANADLDFSEWLVPIYLVQNICLNTHVVGRLVGVYRDFIVGRTSKTPGTRGYARLCTRQEGRNLTRWLYYMSERAGLIPNWTIVTSRCLLIQWRDFLQFLPNNLVQVFEIDLSLTFQLPPQGDEQAIMTSASQDGLKSIQAPCSSVKMAVHPPRAHARSHDKPATKNTYRQERPSCPENVGLVAEWTAPLWEDSELPFTEIREEVIPEWATHTFHDKLDSANANTLNLGDDGGQVANNAIGNYQKASCSTDPMAPGINLPEIGIKGSTNDCRPSSLDKARIQINLAQTKSTIGQGSNEKVYSAASLNKTPSPRMQRYPLRKELRDASKDESLHGRRSGDLEESKKTHQSDTSINAKSPRLGKGQVSTNRSAQNFGSGMQYRSSKNDQKTTDLEVEMKQDRSPDKISASEISKEIIDSSSYEKYANMRKQTCDATQVRKSSKSVSSKQETTESKSPRQHAGIVPSSSDGKKTTDAQIENKREDPDNETGGRKNRFEGLTLWGEEDEMPELGSYFKTPETKKKTPNDKKSTTKTVSWHIPGVYPREKQSKQNVNEKPTKAKGPPTKARRQKSVKTKSSPPNTNPDKVDSIGSTGGGETNNLYMPDERKISENKVKGSTRKDNTEVEARPSSLTNNVSRDTILEPGGKFVGYVPRYYGHQVPKSATHIISLHVETPRCDVDLSPEKQKKAEKKLKDEQTIAKRFTLGRTSRSQETNHTEGSTTFVKSAKSAIHICQVTIPVSDQSPPQTEDELRTYTCNREISNTQPKNVESKVSFDCASVKIEAGSVVGEEDQPLGCEDSSDGESDLKVQVDRTEVVKSFSIVQQQKMLLEAIKKKARPKPMKAKMEPVEVRMEPPKKELLKRWTQNKAKIQQEIYAPKVEFNIDKIKKRTGEGSTKKSAANKATDKLVLHETCSPSNRSSRFIESSVSRNPDKELYSFRPHKDARQSVSNRGLAFYKDLAMPYVAMNGYKYITLKDAAQVFPHCRPNCCVAKSFLRSHRTLHRTMCSWDQVYDFELTQPSRKPPVRTGDLLLRFDTLMARLAQLEHEIQETHKRVKSKRSKGCDYAL